MRSAAVALALAAAPAALAQVDLIISDLPDIVRKGSVGQIHGYAVGFTVCNIGDQHASWQSQTPLHPVEGWAMYRIANGRFEQIGLSWLKHGNFAASTAGCGPCDTRINGARLGVGCRDTYDAAFNSSSFGLGARSDVNPATGVFPYPPRGHGITGNNIYKMCQVAQSDLTTPGALYLVEGLIIHPEDAAGGRALNNASYRRVTVNTSNFAITVTGTTQQETPAIFAWRDLGLAGLPDPDVVITPVDIPGDGRVYVASKASRLPSGLWRYEYAVQNFNSNRAVGAFIAPIPAGSAPAAPSFHDVNPHSDEIYSGADWTLTTTDCAARWATTPYLTNPSANALRFGSVYNFGFESPLPPRAGAITLELFTPGVTASVPAAAMVPAASSADFNDDGFLDFFDYDAFVQAFESGDPSADFNADAFLDFFDYDTFVSAFEHGC